MRRPGQRFVVNGEGVKTIGVLLAGFEFGVVYAGTAAQHGVAWTVRENVVSAVLGLAVLLVASL